MTIFLTTQYLEEADELADRVAIIDRGHSRRRSAAGPEGLLGGELINVTFKEVDDVESAKDELIDMLTACRWIARPYVCIAMARRKWSRP